ncbi:MAG: BamA/TamA family outer membrane protein [Gammaproteobacteria bacterium]|nr:BamA/TamA family outer membrane protein [Gammaproteobacteria bacterium]MCP4875214.1 BamA/TamA family outer membrane protein [Gammaproteobacteria bacterium]
MKPALNVLTAVRFGLLWLAVFTAIVTGIPASHAQEATQEAESPWLLVPTLTSDPKLGTSLGFIGGYLHQFDPGSQQSIFALRTSYSDTDSRITGLFGQLFFDRDRQKLILGLVDGKIENDYEDFLGSGLPVQTTDKLNAEFARYYHEISGGWYGGVQVISTNYTIGADGVLDFILDFIGLTGFDSTGLGLVVEYDTRDNARNPTGGRQFEFSNFAYRESLGGDESFDVYQGKYSQYVNFKKDHILAWQVKGRWTDEAPIGGYSSIQLRGYVRGNYLAPNYTHLQVEDRISFAPKWGMSVFGGVGCLYDGLSDCEDSENLYPAAGAGIIYTLKREAGIVIRAEIAKGESDEATFYLGMGNSF